MNTDRLIARIEAMEAMADPKSPKLRQALTRIGSILQAEMKLNIGRQGIIDQGGLFNSIRYIISQKSDGMTLEVGSFGIRYAAINEFGGKMSKRQVRGMFAGLRERGKIPGRSGGKGIVSVNPDGTGKWKARPYIRPALLKHKNNIIELIRAIGEP